MMETKTGITASLPSVQRASWARVAATAILALFSSVIALDVIAHRATYRYVHLTGAKPAFGFFALWLLLGLAITFIGRLRTLFIGAMVFTPLVVAISVRDGSPWAIWTSILLGCCVSLVGLSFGARSRMTKAGHVSLALVCLASIAPVAIGAHQTAVGALSNVIPSGAEVMASLPIGNQVWFLTRNNKSTVVRDHSWSQPRWINGYSLEAVHRKGFSWIPSFVSDAHRDREVLTNTQQPAYLYSSGAPGYPNANYPSYPEYIQIPGACASPNVMSVPYDEVMSNCWIPDSSFYVGIAPRSASRLDIDYPDHVRHITLPQLKTDPAGVILSTDRNANFIRLAFRGDQGSLLDAVPSMRFASTWYGQIALAAGARWCDTAKKGTVPCTQADVASGSAIPWATVSLSLLQPSEYMSYCSISAAPKGEWVIVAAVSLARRTIGLQWSEPRSVFSGDGFREVVAGVRSTGGGGQPEIDPKTFKVRSTDRACFKPSSLGQH